MKRNSNKKNCHVGIAFVALGIGIVAVCIFPSEWIVAIIAITLVVAGVMLMKR